MARRIKEEPIVHRDRIAAAAEALFLKKGLRETAVSDIAAEAGYSKATLYVYFENKEAIISYLVLKSMSELKTLILEKTDQAKSEHDNFLGICHAVLEYRDRFPIYFSLMQDHINVDFTGRYADDDKETYEIGESINAYITELFDLKQNAFAQIFSFWSFLCGIIGMASAKSDYIKKQSDLAPDIFLEQSFELLYKAFRD